MLLMSLFKPEYGIQDTTETLLRPDKLTGRKKQNIAQYDLGAVNLSENYDDLITALQIIRKTSVDIGGELEETLEKLKDLGVSLPEAQKAVELSASRIRWIFREAKYHSRHLLDGDLTAKLLSKEGRSVSFDIMGFVNKEEFAGLPFTLLQKPSHSRLKGCEELSPDLLGRESKLIFYENGKSLVYRTKETLSAEELVENLNFSLEGAGLNLYVRLNEDGCLSLSHHFPGSEHEFAALSEKTRMISDSPGNLVPCQPGQNVKVKIGEGVYEGLGHLLEDVQTPSGNVIQMRINNDLPLNREFTLQVFERGLKMESSRVAGYFSFPCLEPEKIGCQVANESDFSSLAELLIHSETTIRDARIILKRAMAEMRAFGEAVDLKIEQYSSRDRQRSYAGMAKMKLREEDFISFEKAQKMARDINKIILKMQDFTHI